MTLDEILERVFDRGYDHGLSAGYSNDGESKAVAWGKKKILSLLPKEKVIEYGDEEYNAGYNQALADIKERIEHENM